MSEIVKANPATPSPASWVAPQQRQRLSIAEDGPLPLPKMSHEPQSHSSLKMI